MLPLRVAAYMRWSGPMTSPVNLWPVAADCSWRENCTLGSSVLPLDTPVVNVELYGTNAAPVVSFTPEVTTNVYCVRGSRMVSGVSTIESPPPDVFSRAATWALSEERRSWTVEELSESGSTPWPTLGIVTSAAMNPLRGALIAPLAGRLERTVGWVTGSAAALRGARDASAIWLGPGP